MPTWKDRFNELSTEQSRALEEVKSATSEAEWIAATRNVRKTVDAISEFLGIYESAGAPSRDEDMPNN